MRGARFLPRLGNVLIDSFQLKICCRFLKRFLLIVGFLCIHVQLPAEYFNSFLYSDYNNCNSSIFHKKQLPVVFTGEPVDITTNSAVIAGKVVAKSADIVDRGFYWGKEPDPYENGDQISMGSGYGNFYFTLQDLELNTTYFVVAYAVNDIGVAFGEIKSFITLAELPVVKTVEATDLTATEATIAGEVVSNGGADIIEQGWYLSTSPNPAGATEPIIDETGETTFIRKVTNLEPNTRWYVVAFAKNIQGTGYGEIKTFHTPAALPDVITGEPIEINTSTAILGGEVFSDGGLFVFERGIIWSADSLAILNGIEIPSGSGIGYFEVYVSDLQPDREYFYAAWAENELGRSYGEVISFTTDPMLTLKFLPNAFMPDSHLHENREFKPLFYVAPEIYSLKIYNRWGSEIFSTNMADHGWNGRINNNDAPQGSYAYRLHYVDELGIEHQMSGTLMLIR